MRFMSIVKADRDYEAGRPPNPELMAAIGKLTHEMMQSGAVVEVGGLLPTSAGARVRAAGGKVTVVDGPFAEVKELIGGYAILQANSKAEAIELARQFMKVHADILGTAYEGECEIRQMYAPGECGSNKID